VILLFCLCWCSG